MVETDLRNEAKSIVDDDAGWKNHPILLETLKNKFKSTLWIILFLV